MKLKSIRRDLLLWQIGALLVTGLLASVITYAFAWNAFNTLRDDGLAQIAYSIVRHGIVSSDDDEDDVADKGRFVSQIWDNDNELVFSSLDNTGPPRQEPGHHTVDWRKEKWHTYTLEDDGLTIQVGNPSTYHYADFRKSAPWLECWPRPVRPSRRRSWTRAFWPPHAQRHRPRPRSIPAPVPPRPLPPAAGAMCGGDTGPWRWGWRHR